MSPEGSFTCPICGYDVPAKAKACPDCGSCDKTGWSEAARAGDGLDLPEDPLERARIERKMGYWTLFARIFFAFTLILLGAALLVAAWAWVTSLWS